ESPPNGDSRFVYNIGAIQSIALSTAVNDAGVFELNFRDERYLPFEGTGAIGSWRLQLPTVVRRFDYSTITDVIFHIRYTARDGGSVFRQAVEQAQLQSLNQMVLDATHSGLYQAYNLKQQFPTEWAQLLKTSSTKLTISSRHLPYFAQSHAPKITTVAWFVNSTGNSSQFSFSLDGQIVNLSRDTKFGNLYLGSSVSGAVALDHELVFSVDASVISSLIEIAALVQYEITT
ncbi:putative Insecticidal toxin complex protein TccB2, partial [Serendipita sp. 407]